GHGEVEEVEPDVHERSSAPSDAARPGPGAAIRRLPPVYSSVPASPVDRFLRSLRAECRPRSTRRPVEELQQVMCGQFDGLVPPFRGTVDAGDQAGAVDATEVADDERISGLRLVVRPFGKPQMPGGVLVPGVVLQV